MIELPAPVREAFAATNAGDLGRFVAVFTPDGVIDDWGREFHGHDEIAGWSRAESIGVQQTFEVTEASRGRRVIVTATSAAAGSTDPRPSRSTWRRRHPPRAHDDHGMSDATGRESDQRRGHGAVEGGLVADPGDPATRPSARSFGAAASVYHQARPGYPVEAIAWLIGDATRVLDLGAGTGKLTEALVALDRDVIAVDPVEEMLEELEVAVPGVPRILGTAEDIPIEDDVGRRGRRRAGVALVPARARAIPEIARVLRPGGVLGLVWNSRDTRVDWLREAGEIMHERHDASATFESYVQHRPAVRRDRGAHGRVGRADVAGAVPRPRALAQLLHHRVARGAGGDDRRARDAAHDASRPGRAPRSSPCRTSRAASARGWADERSADDAR